MNIRIGPRPVGPAEPALVVAEIGINHNGDVEIAKKLIDAAQKAGCEAVKFQKRTVPAVYSESELQKSREIPPDIVVRALQRGVLPENAIARLTSSSFEDTTNGDLKWALELTADEYREIDQYCRKKNILWFASPWDDESVEFLEAFNPPAYKIASACLTDDDLLQRVRSKGRPVILSTGMSSLEEIDHAVDILGPQDLVLLHCVSTYPAEDGDLNLRVIEFLKNRYPTVPVGYSGHEKGVYASVHAVAHGACLIERHVTLDRTMWGSDQAASLEPKGLMLMVKTIRNYERTRGDGIKRVLESEIPIMKKLRREKAKW